MKFVNPQLQTLCFFKTRIEIDTYVGYITTVTFLLIIALFGTMTLYGGQEEILLPKLIRYILRYWYLRERRV